MKESEKDAVAVTVEVPATESETDSVAVDPQSPLNWSYRYKMFIVILISAMTTVDTFATLISVPAIPSILAEFGSTNQSYLVILVSIWELGEGLGPFIVAPLSEIYGRLPVYHVANVLFLLCSVAGALSNSLGMLLAFRFLNGSTVASITLGPAMVGDMFKVEERGTAMAALYMGPLLGPLCAPIVGGFLANAEGWRWNFWLISIAVAAIQIPSLIFMRETSTKRLARHAQNADERPSARMTRAVKQAVIRPLRFLILCPVVAIMALYAAIICAFLYIILTTLTSGLESVYGFSENSAGLAYVAMGIGMVLGVVLCAATSDAYIKSKGRLATPEHRLLLAAVGGFFIPVGLILYGWTFRGSIHWIVPLVGTALVGFGMMATVVQAESYLVDAYTEQSAAAVAAVAIERAIIGAVLPLAGPPLYDRLGLGWGNSLLAFVALALMPVPLLFMKYGAGLRARWPIQ